MTAPRAALGEIQQRADAATDGPWVRDGSAVWQAGADGECVLGTVSRGGTRIGSYDLDFFAAARTDVPRLAKALADVLDLADSNSGLWTFEVRNLIAAALAGES